MQSLSLLTRARLSTLRARTKPQRENGAKVDSIASNEDEDAMCDAQSCIEPCDHKLPFHNMIPAALVSARLSVTLSSHPRIPDEADE